MPICSELNCNETNPNNFYKYLKRKDQPFYDKCKKCHNKKRTELNRKTKERIINFMGGKCSRCGYNKCKRALELHHKIPELKDPLWKILRNYTFWRIQKEIEKCELLCSNCHREVHEELHLDGDDN